MFHSENWFKWLRKKAGWEHSPPTWLTQAWAGCPLTKGSHKAVFLAWEETRSYSFRPCRLWTSVKAKRLCRSFREQIWIDLELRISSKRLLFFSRWWKKDSGNDDPCTGGHGQRQSRPTPAHMIPTPKYYSLQQGKKMPFLKLRKCQLPYHRGQFK